MTTDELIADCRTNDDPLVTVLCEHLEYLQADLEAEIESHSETRRLLGDLDNEAELEVEELRARIAELEAEVAELEGKLENMPDVAA